MLDRNDSTFCRFGMAKTVGEFQCSMVIKTLFTSIILRRTDENVEVGAANFIRCNSQIKSHYLNSIQVANHRFIKYKLKLQIIYTYSNRITVPSIEKHETLHCSDEKESSIRFVNPVCFCQ